ncbi:hypothetical protein [Bradyrhizobium valentinum]|uniref:hypothetical protein n=1 Tax=Bradyrhizobium valentinum TaxID=1518501 RepID=UPI0018D20D8E|nr:hypothetical protein [Bradyrhizobium valentinum]
MQQLDVEAHRRIAAKRMDRIPSSGFSDRVAYPSHHHQQLWEIAIPAIQLTVSGHGDQTQSVASPRN